MAIKVDVHQASYFSGEVMGLMAIATMQPASALALCAKMLAPSTDGAKVIISIDSTEVVIGCDYNMTPRDAVQIREALPGHHWWTHTFRLDDDQEPDDNTQEVFSHLRWMTTAFARMFHADGADWCELGPQVIEQITPKAPRRRPVHH